MEDRPPVDAADDELIVAARNGDDDAFAILVARHQDMAFRAAYLVLGDADAAADAAQEGFIAVHASLGRFRARDPFRPWLLRIVGNRARNLRRGAGRRMAATLRLAADRGDRVAPSPEVVVVRRGEQAEMLAAVNAMSAEDRAVLACRYFLDLSEAETAELLGVARGTVKSRLARARTRLRTTLGAAGEVDHG